MAIGYYIPQALTSLRSLIIAALTNAGETPTMVPATFAAQQYDFKSAPKPLTLIEVRSTPFKRGGDNAVQGVQDPLSLNVHHVRTRQSGGSSDIVAIERLAAIAALIEQDVHIAAFASPTGLAVEECVPNGVVFGEDNPLAMALAGNVDTNALALATLEVRLMWRESLI